MKVFKKSKEVLKKIEASAKKQCLEIRLLYLLRTLIGGLSMKKLKRNAIQCRKCGDVIESKITYDFKYCS
ncbi:DUF7695 domain-containing protein [Bacillus thuringiensis]|uniref:DUF7695 domain-containing protein n=1 Tax=Bacillus thuringiensis TaxID=1428 RepID=UPI003C12BC11